MLNTNFSIDTGIYHIYYVHIYQEERCLFFISDKKITQYIKPNYIFLASFRCTCPLPANVYVEKLDKM